MFICQHICLAFFSEIAFSIIKKNATPLIRTPMGHATVSALGGLILEKVYESFFRRKKRDCPLYTGVCIKLVSVMRGSTVPQLLIFA